MRFPSPIFGVAVLALTACHSNTADQESARQPVAAKTAPGKQTRPRQPKQFSPAQLAFTGYHRYVGTVGTLPVVLELTITTDSAGRRVTGCDGSYFYVKHAGQLALQGIVKPGQPLYLSESEQDASTTSGHWQADQPAGPRLTGTWFSARGPRLPFQLREDYTDAVRYELIEEAATGEPCHPESEEGAEPASWTGQDASYGQTFVHLLGPDTLRPALRRLQCPVPAGRRATVAAAASSEANSCTEESLSCYVTFNSFGLLSLSQTQYYYGFGAAHPSHSHSGSTYNLRTGRALTLAELFRPGTDTLVQRLLSRHLLQQAQQDGLAAIDAYNWSPPDLPPIPRGAAYLTAAGLYFGYDDYEIAGYSAGDIGVLLPYRELRPLLRPDSPVARMLRARGLW